LKLASNKLILNTALSVITSSGDYQFQLKSSLKPISRT